MIETSFRILGILTRDTNQVISEGKSINHMWADPMKFINYFIGEIQGRERFSIALYGLDVDWTETSSEFHQHWGNQIPWDKIPPEKHWQGGE